MISFIFGIAIGAAFSKFWIGLYEKAKPRVLDFLKSVKK